MKHCLKFFVHDRKARARRPPSNSRDGSICQSLDELPSYTDLFGPSNTYSDHFQSLSQDKTLTKQPAIKSEEALATASKEILASDSTQCITILEERSGRKQIDDRRLGRLAAKFGGCQTTAHIVGTYISQTEISCGKYMRIVQDKSEVNLHSALSQTLDHIKKINPDAAQLFMFFAYFDYTDLAYDLVAAANVTQSTWISRITSSFHEYESTMNWLQGYGLINSNTIIYAIDPLIHQWLTRSLLSGPLFSTFSMALRCVVSAQELVIQRNQRGKSCRFAQHAQHLTTLPFESMWRFAMRDSSCVESIILLAHNCLCQKQVDSATALNELVLNAPCLTGRNMSNLAKNFVNQGKKSEAERLFKQALDLFRADRTSDSIAYLKTLRRLDHLSKTLSRIEECETILQDVLNARFKMQQGTPSTSEVVRAHAELGLCRHDQKRYDEAIILYRAALEDHESLLDPHDDHILFVHERMGNTFRNQKEFDKAGFAYGRALLGFSERFGRFSVPRNRMATRLEKVAVEFRVTEEGRRLMTGSKDEFPHMKLFYSRWGCADA